MKSYVERMVKEKLDIEMSAEHSNMLQKHKGTFTGESICLWVYGFASALVAGTLELYLEV